MQITKAAEFKLVSGGKPAPPPEPEAPDPNAPIDLGPGIYRPRAGRFDFALPGGLGGIAPIFCDEASARRIAALVHGRKLSDVLALDFTEARAALIAGGVRYCLAASREHVGFVALWHAIVASETGATWREVASFDHRLSGIAADFAGQYTPGFASTEGEVRRFRLWSVPKERRRLGLFLRSGNKEATVIQADTLPSELLRDAQILILASSAERSTEAA